MTGRRRGAVEKESEQARRAFAQVTGELEALDRRPLPALMRLYEQIFGARPRVRARKYVAKALAYWLQEQKRTPSSHRQGSAKTLEVASEIAYNIAGSVGGAHLDSIDYAALVSAIRAARGVTQEELARSLDVTVGTLSGWENGRHRPVKAQRKRLLGMAQRLGLRAEATDRRDR